MKYDEMKNILASLMKSDYKNFVKAFLSLEAGILEEPMLEDIYNEYFSQTEKENKLSDMLVFKKFEYETREKSGEVVADQIQNENAQYKITGIVIKDPVYNGFLRRGQETSAISFSVVSDEKIYNCIAYDAYKSYCENIKKGDTVSVSGYYRINEGKEGKLYHNISIRSAEVIHNREKMEIHSGRLCGGPQRFSFQNENGLVEVANFSIREKVNDKNHYLRCSLYGKDISMLDKIKPGTIITVMGRNKINKGKDGAIYHNFICDKIEMLDKEKGSETVSITERLRNREISKEEMGKPGKPTLKNDYVR